MFKKQKPGKNIAHNQMKRAMKTKKGAGYGLGLRRTHKG